MDIEFIFTPTIKSALNQVLIHAQSIGLPKDQLEQLQKYNTNANSLKSIPYKIIKQLAIHLKDIYINNNNSKEEEKEVDKEEDKEESGKKKKKSQKDPACYLHELLNGSTIYIEPRPVTMESAEKQAQRIYLQNQLDQQRYNKIVKNVETNVVDDRMELSDFRSQLSIGLNILVTFFTVLVGGMFIGNKYYGSYLVGLCFGLACGILAVTVEIWLFVLKSGEHEIQKNKDTRAENRKKDHEIRKISREIQKQQILIKEKQQKEKLQIVEETKLKQRNTSNLQLQIESAE